MNRWRRRLAGAAAAVAVVLICLGGGAPSGLSLTVDAVLPGVTQPPSVSGVTEVGETLSASTGEWLGTEPLTYTYQWLRCDSSGGGCVEIGGATGSTYALGEDSLGSTLRVQVTAANTVGVVSARSDTTAVITSPPSTLTPPVNTGLPEVSGVLEVGQTVTASSGAWSGTEPISFSYQWQRCDALGGSCTDLAGATGTSYTLTSDLLGATLRVRVLASNAAGPVEATSPASTPVTTTTPALAPAPTNSAPPTLSGTAEVGQTLTASTGDWTGEEPLAYDYQWLRCDAAGAGCVEIAGATDSSLTLTEASLDATVRVRVTATDSAGSTSALSASSATITAASAAPPGEPPANLSAPAIAGLLEVGETVTASTGVWSGEQPLTYQYQWLRCDAAGNGCIAIGGADSAELLLTADLEGARLQVTVTATDSAGSTSASSPVSATVAPAAPVAVAPANTAAPSIAGVLEVGETVTASAGQWTGTEPLAYAYQWLRCDTLSANCAAISGATNATYALTDAVLGSTLQLRVTVTNAAGSPSALSPTSDVVVAPLAGAPVNISPPTVSGEALVGQTLTASAGSWSGTAPISYTYQWQRCDSSGASCLDIAGATAASYTLNTGTADSTLRVRVTATDSAGSTSARSAATAAVSEPAPASTPPVNIRPPALSGLVAVGQTLTASTGLWDGTAPLSYRYQWLRCDSLGAGCNEIAGQTTSSLTLTSELESATVRVRVSADNTAGTASALSPATTPLVAAPAPAPPANTTPPSISGELQAGQTLQASTGTWTATEPIIYSYQWLRCDSSGADCTAIAGATGPTHALTDAGVGTTLRVRVTATTTAGSASARSEATAAIGAAPQEATASAPAHLTLPTVSGVIELGQTLTASTGTWTGTAPLAYSYQWLRCSTSGNECVTVSGATNTTYTLSETDLDSTLRVRISAHNSAGSATAASLATSALEVEQSTSPPANTSPPAVGEEPQIGQPLTASTGAWLGATPISYRFQWLRCDTSGANCTEIPDATKADYTPGENMLGATLRVRVTATDAGGSTQATSAVAGPVAAALALEFPANVGLPSISGTAQAGQTLTASSGAWTGTPPITYRYQWLRCNGAGADCTPIPAATAATLTLTVSEVAATVRVQVTATSDAGTTSAASAATPPITPDPALEATIPPPTIHPADGTILTAATSITITAAAPIHAILEAALDGQAVTATIDGTTVTITTGPLATGPHTLNGVLVYQNGTQAAIRTSFTIQPKTAAAADTSLTGTVDPSTGRTIDLAPDTSAELPPAAVEDPGNHDQIILTIHRSHPTNPPTGIAVPRTLPNQLAFASHIYTITAAWQRAGTPITRLAKPLHITIPAQTINGARAPANTLLATAPARAITWRLTPRCARQGQLPPKQTDCYTRHTDTIDILTRHLSHYALLQPTPLAVSLRAPARIPLYRMRFVPARITLTRPARVTLALQTPRGHVIRRTSRTLKPGTSTLLLRRIPAHPFPRSGRYTLTLRATSAGQTRTIRRTIKLIRTH